MDILPEGRHHLEDVAMEGSAEHGNGEPVADAHPSQHDGVENTNTNQVLDQVEEQETRYAL